MKFVLTSVWSSLRKKGFFNPKKCTDNAEERVWIESCAKARGLNSVIFRRKQGFRCILLRLMKWLERKEMPSDYDNDYNYRVVYYP
jgi:hypothetical protein